MTVTYVGRQNEKRKLSSEVTSYILPNSGYIEIKESVSPLVYVNGDSYETKKGMIRIPIVEKSLELEVDDQIFDIRVLCREYKDSVKFDYHALGTAFVKNLVQGRMDEDILFGAIEEDLEELKIPLCTFHRKFDSITKNYDVEAMSDCVDKLPHIFVKPKQHLKQVNEIRPAAVVSRIGQESIRHLASHSEHWKGIKASGLVPERLLARSLEDDFAIYENLAVKTLVDRLYKEMLTLNEDNMDCSMQMDTDDGHAVSGEQKTYFHARDVLLKGMDDDMVVFHQLFLEEQREYITNIISKLKKCRSTPLYRTLKKQKSIYGKLKKTNIFMLDKYYKYAYELWGLMENKQEAESYDVVQEVEGEYALFCKILFLFALKYFQFEADDNKTDIFVDDHLQRIAYTFDRWHLSVSSINVEKLDISGFSAELYMDHPIRVLVSPLEISDRIVSKYEGVEWKKDALIFHKAWDDKKQEDFIREVKAAWPGNKRKIWASELRQKMYAAFTNYRVEKKKILFVPWKYMLPDNSEEVRQAILQIEKNIHADDFDMVYILTASRPNEFSNIKEITVLNKMLFYGKANKMLGLEKSRFGVIPISLSDINSYRRYTKILLDQMIRLDHDRKTCPICGDKMNIGRGDQSNIASCHTCGFQIIDTRCSECMEEFSFTRYVLPKTTTDEKADHQGFKVIAAEHRFGFKNITDVYLDENQIHPICPCCGNWKKSVFF